MNLRRLLTIQSEFSLSIKIITVFSFCKHVSIKIDLLLICKPLTVLSYTRVERLYYVFLQKIPFLYIQQEVMLSIKFYVLAHGFVRSTTFVLKRHFQGKSLSNNKSGNFHFFYNRPKSIFYVICIFCEQVQHVTILKCLANFVPKTLHGIAWKLEANVSFLL